METEKTPTQVIPCSDLVCTNQFSLNTSITLLQSQQPIKIDGQFVVNTLIISNNVICTTAEVTCEAPVVSGCGTAAGEVTLLGLFLSGSIFYTNDLLFEGLCNSQAHASAGQILTIPTNTLACLSSTGELDCANFSLCPEITTTVTGPVDCPGLTCSNVQIFQLNTTFTFACPGPVQERKEQH